MRLIVIGAAGLALVALALAASAWLPLPGAKAREAAGQAHTAERDGRTIAYHVLGQGPRVVLLASAGREASDFNELAAALAAAGYRTLAIEPPGVGGSDGPKGAKSLWDMADDIDAVLAADGARAPAAVVGHAFGNRLARAFAARHPERVRAVILLAAGGQRPVPEKAATALKACFNPLKTRGQRLRAIRYGFFADANPVPDHWTRGWHPLAALAQGRALQAVDAAEWQGAGGRPMLIVQAAQDRIAPKADAADVLKAQLGDQAQVVVIENAGHALLPEQPAAVARAVADYLAGP